MAKFKQNNVELRDNQKLIFDSAKNKYMSYDGTELFVNSTISGVDPTQDYHLTTRQYVDTVTSGGSSVQYLDDLLDVTSNNPLDNQVLTYSGTQWIPTTQVSFTGGSMGEWEYKGVSADVDPGSKRFKVDNSDATLITELYVSDLNRSDIDLGNFLGNFVAGDQLYLQKTNVSAQAYLYTVVSVVDNTTYHTFTVTYDDYTGIEFSDKDKITFVKLAKNTSGITDHGLLTGLGDDDHLQYLLRTDFTTHSGNSDAHHAESHTVVSHSDTSATGAELDTLTGGGDTTLHDHDGISENSAARHAESHTIASHSDTTGTGPELDELTDGSETTLHSHAGGGSSVFGTEHDYNSSEGESSTTNSAPQEKVTLALTSLPAGTYRIDYSLEGSSDDDKNSLFSAHVQIDDTTTIFEAPGSASLKGWEDSWMPYAGFYETSLSGDVDIDIDYWDAGAAVVGVNIRRARLSLFRVE